VVVLPERRQIFRERLEPEPVDAPKLVRLTTIDATVGFVLMVLMAAKLSKGRRR
jgi:hypothetical protein